MINSISKINNPYFLFQMKTFLLISFLLLLGYTSMAQTSSTEAKAAYLLAEEAFNAGDWKGTISYLEQSKKKIGSPNSKILYLQIMAEMELAKSDTSYNSIALNTIAAFESAADVKDFNEDKSLEVMKTKIRLNRIQEQAAKDKQAKVDRAIWVKTIGGAIVSEKDGHGLVMANADIGKMNLDDAKKTCEGLVLNGHDDWRLPTLAEFQQMVTASTQLATQKSQQPGYVPLAGIYWTAELNGGAPMTKKFAAQNNKVRPVRTF
jgi:hypothetical protein